MQERLLGYFSLASYSLSHRALNEDQFDFLNKILEIYRFADPENSEHAYLKAVYFARIGKNENIIPALKEAVNLGFNQKQRLMEQIEFQTLHGNSEFTTLIANK
jgi:hypothetical protein